MLELNTTLRWNRRPPNPARDEPAGRIRRAVCAAAAALALACAPHAEQTTVTITGSSTIAPLMLEIGKRFESTHPGVRIDVQSGGSSRGVSDARQGLAQIGMVSRAGKDDERDLQWVPIALDGIAIILHKENPVSALSSDQIRAIYRKEIKNWSEVGGKDAPITVVNKAEGRSTLELFAGHFKLKPEEIKADVVIGENLQGIKTVAGNPDSIGYVSIGTAEYESKAGTPIKVLGPDGSTATLEGVRNKSYPVSRELNLVLKGTPAGTVKEIVDFAQSPAVRDLVEEQFFVPLDG